MKINSINNSLSFKQLRITSEKNTEQYRRRLLEEPVDKFEEVDKLSKDNDVCIKFSRMAVLNETPGRNGSNSTPVIGCYLNGKMVNRFFIGDRSDIGYLTYKCLDTVQNLLGSKPKTTGVDKFFKD